MFRCDNVRVYRHRFGCADYLLARASTSTAKLGYSGEDFAPLNRAETALLKAACAAFKDRCAVSLRALAACIAAVEAHGGAAAAARSPPARDRDGADEGEDTPAQSHLETVAEKSIPNKRKRGKVLAAAEQLAAGTHHEP